MKEQNTAVKPKGIPYGMMNFVAIREDNYYYVDKTRFIEKVLSSNLRTWQPERLCRRVPPSPVRGIHRHAALIYHRVEVSEEQCIRGPGEGCREAGWGPGVPLCGDGERERQHRKHNPPQDICSISGCGDGGMRRSIKTLLVSKRSTRCSTGVRSSPYKPA